MKRNFMKELKERHGAWLVVSTIRCEDAGEPYDVFLIFTDNNILAIEHSHDEASYTVVGIDEYYNSVEVDNLEHYKHRLEHVLPKLDEERQMKLRNIMSELNNCKNDIGTKLKVIDSKRWSSSGDEFLKKLEEKGISYKKIYEGLKIFEATTPGIAGGKTFDILDYNRKSDGQRVLVAHGGFGAGDVCIEEVYIMEVAEGQRVTEEGIVEELREYIGKEEQIR